MCPTTLRFELNDSYSKMQEFADCHLWSTLVRKHNDPEDDIHIGLYDFYIISHQNEAAFDVLCSFERLQRHQSRLGISSSAQHGCHLQAMSETHLPPCILSHFDSQTQ